MREKLKKLGLWCILLCIGFVTGSILAPFEVRLRRDSALPIANAMDGLPVAFNDSLEDN